MLLIPVLHLEKRLPVLDGELRHHRARPEHIAVPSDVVAEDLGEDPPTLTLHCPILCQIRSIAWAFDFVRVAAVPLVGLDPLARLEEITQNLVENDNVEKKTYA